VTTQRPEYLQLDSFLAPEDHARMLEHALGLQEFEPAQVSKPGGVGGEQDRGVRSASVASPEALFDLFEETLRTILPHARMETGVPRFELGMIERQLTAHGDGDFFDLHTDLGNSWTESSGRRLSFVYYFHETPKSFEGGELRLYDTEIDEHGQAVPASTFQEIEPTDNSIVFFPSHAFHEVRPVVAPHGEAGSTRFTVTGWFHDAAHRVTPPPLDPDQHTALTERYTPSFTEHGFMKVRTPPSVHRWLRNVYDERIGSAFTEYLANGEPYLSSAPDFLDIEDVKQQVLDYLRPIHESWSGQELVPTAAYGLRVYRRGQTLRSHTDHLETHVISSIVHIAHDTDEPWPLRVTDLHGVEHDVVLDEGEMLLYESARCPHGRPTPLEGDAYCSLFLHYKPIDWNVTTMALIDQALADGATDILPEEFWPQPDAAQ
jgi:hypothetical protein